MPRTFALPSLGSNLQEGTISAWHVAVGDEVKADEPLCDVDTEKSTIEIPVPFDGVILELAGPEGTTVAVGAPLAVIGSAADEPEPVVAAVAHEPQSVAVGAVSASPATADTAGRTSAAGVSVAGTAIPVPPRALATPVARRMARAHGIDLRAIAGSGRGGRICRADLQAAIAAPAAPAGNGKAPKPAERASDRVPMSRFRRAIAEHMTRQWTTVPHVTGHTDAEVSRLFEVRRALGARIGTKVPFDALLMAAALPALRRFPETNATVEGDELVLRRYYDVGFAIASDAGLVVPVVRGADRLGLAELSERVTELTEKALKGALTPDDQGGQSFTISNIGGTGADHATQIIPAGTTAIASFGRAREQPVVRDGELAIGRVMSVSGTFDHRAVDGAPAMRFVATIVEGLEEPAVLLA